MKIIFNDLSELEVQVATIENGYLQVKTISATATELKAKFNDPIATKHMKVVERGQIIAEYEGYTTLYRMEEYVGGILGVAMYKPAETPEAQLEVQAAAVEVARIQAQSLTDEEALTVQAIYPEWNGNGIAYPKDYKVLQNEILYRCLQEHTSQATWSPEVAPSLWAKVLNPNPDVIPEWQQPDSTNGYMIGDKVTHNGKKWESQVDNNVWEPEVAGTETLWAEVEG